MNQNCIISIFLKPPLPGRVKTRLAKDIGIAKAADIYIKLVESIIASATESKIDVAIFFDGDRVEELPKAWIVNTKICSQQTGKNLGERMGNAFLKLFSNRYSRALLCGSDIIGLDSNYFRKAATALQKSEMVISPAEDGGYSLIGFRKEFFNAAIFEEISWSSEKVLAQTLENCKKIGLKPHLLDTLKDIDSFDDLKNAAPELLI